jgi:hypothetical protein
VLGSDKPTSFKLEESNTNFNGHGSNAVLSGRSSNIREQGLAVPLGIQKHIVRGILIFKLFDLTGSLATSKQSWSS